MMIITKTRFKSRELLQAIFCVCKNKSAQVPSCLKYVFDLIKLNKFKDSINDVNTGLFGSMIKFPKIIWLP